MSLFLLDANAVSDVMADHPRFRARLSSLGPTDQAITCTIVRGEILFGIERLAAGRRKQDLLTAAGLAFRALECHAVPEAVADHYARIKVACQQLGRALDENDLWIAATTLALGAALVTRDNDYRSVPGLTIQDWTT
jgi:predicted nucleic acid-binding protein